MQEGQAAAAVCMCSWSKQGEIQMKRTVILPVPGASLLGNVTLANSLFSLAGLALEGM